MSDTFPNDDDGEILDDDDTISDDVSDATEPVASVKVSKAWRSIERYREMKELREQLDDFLLEDFSEANLKDLNL